MSDLSLQNTNCSGAFGLICSMTVNQTHSDFRARIQTEVRIKIKRMRANMTEQTLTMLLAWVPKLSLLIHLESSLSLRNFSTQMGSRVFAKRGINSRGRKAMKSM